MIFSTSNVGANSFAQHTRHGQRANKFAPTPSRMKQPLLSQPVQEDVK